MPVPRFYVGPKPLSPGSVVLSPQEHQHARGSRRLKPGSQVQVFDGLGHEAVGILESCPDRSLQVTIQEIDYRSSDLPLDLALAVAMPKSTSRQDLLVEKCTEIGLSTLIPIVCERSVVRPSRNRISKWKRTSIEACKQSGRAWLPKVLDPISFEQGLQTAAEYDLAVITNIENDAGFHPDPRLHGRVIVFVGPEGGWTPEEQRQATAHQCYSFALGPTVLRSETAAIAALSQLIALLRVRG